MQRSFIPKIILGLYLLFSIIANNDIKGQIIDVNIGVIIDTIANPCEGPVTLDAHHNGFNFLWSTGETTQKIVVTKSGSYWVRVTDPKNILLNGSDTATVAYGGKFKINLGPDITQCGGCVNLDAGDYGPGTTYSWKAANQTYFSRSIRACGPALITLKVTNRFGCTAADSINVNITGGYKLDLGSDVYSCEDSAILADNKNTDVRHLWSTGDTTSQITVKKTGKYYLKIFNLKNCNNTNDTITDTINVYLGKPVVHLGKDTSLCGSCLNLSAGNQPPGIIYLWSTGEKTNNIRYCQAGSGTVSLTVSKPAPQGCAASDTIHISFKQDVRANLGSDITACADSVVLSESNNPGAKYLWNTGDTTSTITVISSGNYFVKVFNVSNGCSPKDTLLDSVSVSLLAKIPVPQKISDISTPCGPKTLTVNPVPGATNYTWVIPGGWQIISGQGTPTLQVKPSSSNSEGEFYVKAGNGKTTCLSDSVAISDTAKSYELQIYNAFSPNGDNTNEVWKIKNIEYYPDNTLVILNRWGNEVYNVSDYNPKNFWNGGGLNEGTYYYDLKVNECGVSQTYTGNVTLVR